MIRPLVLFAATVLLACAPGTSDQDTSVASDSLTQRQRDSSIGASDIPGAQGITRAQKVTDSLNARTLPPDSLDRDP